MLILTRKINQSFLISEDIEVTVTEISGDKVRIAIDAPKEVKILRKELIEATSANREALEGSNLEVSQIKSILRKEYK
ncbi:carbon storage regulator CsrA [Sinanaerobacter sp. ZZT-01]|uniref:carbon storage regulator CsrA n=1 Tax=Sinanaerobacter sp. ZZT-01 TaxID=3111540 RepID=UPI002D79F9DA|nr:carbon storage regulator CsrA [Sinanaerobacter sp. ZZT-01]WRR93589.1 carbon storage regulator CsrA [Sinanaerobacter sp. ZZT-01]